MSKKLDNHFVPKYVPNDFPWYERDGLMTWYDQVKCQQFLEDTDEHFQNLKIINFDMINSKGKLTENKMKQYQIVNHHEILTYPPDFQDEIMSPMFRTKRDDMFIKKEAVIEHFSKPVKSYGRGRIKTIGIYVTNKLGKKCFV